MNTEVKALDFNSSQINNLLTTNSFNILPGNNNYNDLESLYYFIFIYLFGLNNLFLFIYLVLGTEPRGTLH